MIKTDNNTGRLYTVDRRLCNATGELVASRTLQVLTDRCNVIILPDVSITSGSVSLQSISRYDYDAHDLLLYGRSTLMVQEPLKEGEVVYLTRVALKDERFNCGSAYTHNRNSLNNFSRIVEAESVDIADIITKFLREGLQFKTE